jgi:uncharacterized phage protein gp47/JayE
VPVLVTPTTSALAQTIVSQVEASISETVPLLPKSFIRVIAKVLAGGLIIIYRYAGFSLLQQFVSTASTKETTVNGRTIIPLVEWGRLVGVGDRDPATRAVLDVTVTVRNQSGSLPASTQVLHTPSGVLYTSVSARALDASTVTLRLRAASQSGGGTGAGAVGNRAPGDVLTFANPLGNVARDVVVSAMVEQGADAEDWEVYRARIARRFSRRPQGGAYADYEMWATEVNGIIAAYPYTGDPGEVDVYVEATEESSGDPDGIPTGAQITAVENSISFDENGLATRRPVNAAVNVLPIARTGFDVIVNGLEAADEAAVEAAIEDAVDEYLRSREPYIVGLSAMPRVDRITLAAVSGVIDEAASAQGAILVSVELELMGISTPNYTLGEGEKAKLASITFP